MSIIYQPKPINTVNTINIINRDYLIMKNRWIKIDDNQILINNLLQRMYEKPNNKTLLIYSIINRLKRDIRYLEQTETDYYLN